MKTILVVDDTSSVRKLLEDYLTQQGFRVVTATNGQEAIYAARHSTPDAILLDVMMPQMDGFEFLRQYRKEKQTPVIVITAKEEETDAVLKKRPDHVAADSRKEARAKRKLTGDKAGRVAEKQRVAAAKRRRSRPAR